MTASVTAPPPDEVFDCHMGDGATIRVRQYARPGCPRLVASHGNGFAIDAYWPFLQHFAERYELVVFDLRNHGHNPRHRIEHHRIERFASDLDTVLDAIDSHMGNKPSVGVFHSVSAIASLVHALRYRWRWHALVAVDPPLVPPPGHHLYAMAHAAELRLSDWAASRRERFDSAEEFAHILATARTNERWVPGAAQAMASAVLRFDEAHDDWSLACPGAFEAQVYADNADLNLGPALSRLQGPLLFACADPRLPNAWSPAKTNAALAATHAHAYHPFEATGHMLQLEQPREVAQRIETFFATVRTPAR